MNRKLTTILFAVLLTSLPLTFIQAGPTDPIHPARLSLGGLLDDCAGFDTARAVPTVPDCIVQAITLKLQLRIESDCQATLQTWSQARPAQMAASADQAAPAS